MYKKVRMLFGLTLAIILTACNAKGNNSTDNALAMEIQTAESVEIPTELPTVEPTEEPTEVPAELPADGQTAEPTATKTEKFPITVDWIETKKEYEAARHKSNGKLEVSVSRISKSIMNEEGGSLSKYIL